MNRDELTTVVGLMVELAKADGTVHPKEDFFIKMFAHSNKMDPGVFDRVCRSPEMYTRDLSSIQDRELAFSRLCSFIHFDMNAHKAELDWCREIGKRLGITDAKTNEVLKKIESDEVPMSIDEIQALVKA